MSTRHVALSLTATLMGLLHALTGSAAEPAATGAMDEPRLEEVVVTAEKREASLQKTAAAVTAIPEEELVRNGIENLQAAQMVIPAVRFQKEGNSTQVFVRGVGQNLDFPNEDPVVAFNFNGVYIPREATSTAFFDLASVEVLPGPQGTLYGRGAMGGTVNVQFKRPGFDDAGDALLEVGNYSLVHGSVAQDIKFSDDLAVRLAVDYDKHSGYMTSGADAPEDLAGRGSFIFHPNERFSAYVWGFYAQNDGKTANLVSTGPSYPGGFTTSNPWNDVGAGKITQALYNSFPPGALPFTVGTPTAEKANYKVHVIGGEFDWIFSDSLKLTYIPGYTSLTSEPYYWLDSFLFHNTANASMQSHELRLTGRGGPVDWLAGAFYYHQNYTGTFTNSEAGLSNFVQEHSINIFGNALQGTGVFGQATWSILEGLRLTGGGRYSYDYRDANGLNPQYTPAGLSPFQAPPNQPWTFSRSYSHVDWKTALEYDVAPEILTYLSVQTGYAPGSYNPINQAGIQAGDPFVNPGVPYDGHVAVQPATLLAIAGGLKARFFGDTLQTNTEIFHYIYKNLVEQEFNAALLYNAVFNAAEVQITGVQEDLLWAPTSHDKFNANIAYTHARNTDFVTPGGADYTGLQPPYSPDWTALGGYSHIFDLPQGSIDASVNVRYESSWFAAFTHAVGTAQDSNTKYDASLTYDSGHRWQLGLWGKNLGNRAVLAATAAAGFPGPGSGYLEAPRTYGGRFSIQY